MSSNLSLAERPAIKLYLDLLERSLTNTLLNAEPDADQDNELRYVGEFIDHYIEGRAISMLPLARFRNIRECMFEIIERQVPGDFIETGVWRGGATIFMRGLLKALDIRDRIVWVADSFRGLPSPDPDKFPVEARAHRGAVMAKSYKHFAVGIDEVRANFRTYGLLDAQVRFLEGWFKDTLPAAPIERLALMRLDGDYYESTMDALVALYDRLSIGGFVIVDDYGEETWTCCRQAVAEFRSSRSITEPLIRVDSKCYFWCRDR